MKETSEDEAVRNKAHNSAQDEIRSFVERAERLDAEKANIAADRKEVMAEAKARGFNVKALNKVIALRKQDADQRAADDFDLSTYMTALGM